MEKDLYLFQAIVIELEYRTKCKKSHRKCVPNICFGSIGLSLHFSSILICVSMKKKTNVELNYLNFAHSQINETRWIISNACLLLVKPKIFQNIETSDKFEYVKEYDSWLSVLSVLLIYNQLLLTYWSQVCKMKNIRLHIERLNIV